VKADNTKSMPRTAVLLAIGRVSCACARAIRRAGALGDRTAVIHISAQGNERPYRMFTAIPGIGVRMRHLSQEELESNRGIADIVEATLAIRNHAYLLNTFGEAAGAVAVDLVVLVDAWNTSLQPIYRKLARRLKRAAALRGVAGLRLHAMLQHQPAKRRPPAIANEIPSPSGHHDATRVLVFSTVNAQRHILSPVQMAHEAAAVIAPLLTAADDDPARSLLTGKAGSRLLSMGQASMDGSPLALRAELNARFLHRLFNGKLNAIRCKLRPRAIAQHIVDRLMSKSLTDEKAVARLSNIVAQWILRSDPTRSAATLKPLLTGMVDALVEVQSNLSADQPNFKPYHAPPVDPRGWLKRLICKISLGLWFKWDRPKAPDADTTALDQRRRIKSFALHLSIIQQAIAGAISRTSPLRIDQRSQLLAPWPETIANRVIDNVIRENVAPVIGAQRPLVNAFWRELSWKRALGQPDGNGLIELLHGAFMNRLGIEPGMSPEQTNNRVADLLHVRPDVWRQEVVGGLEAAAAPWTVSSTPVEEQCIIYFNEELTPPASRADAAVVPWYSQGDRVVRIIHLTPRVARATRNRPEGRYESDHPLQSILACTCASANSDV